MPCRSQREQVVSSRWDLLCVRSHCESYETPRSHRRSCQTVSLKAERLLIVTGQLAHLWTTRDIMAIPQLKAPSPRKMVGGSRELGLCGPAGLMNQAADRVSPQGVSRSKPTLARRPRIGQGNPACARELLQAEQLGFRILFSVPCVTFRNGIYARDTRRRGLACEL